MYKFTYLMQRLSQIVTVLLSDEAPLDDVLSQQRSDNPAQSLSSFNMYKWEKKYLTDNV
jgi:hypothetical protein